MAFTVYFGSPGNFCRTCDRQGIAAPVAENYNSMTAFTVCMRACWLQLRYFSVAMKSFSVLDRIVPSAEVTQGKLAACIGVFSEVVAGKLPK